MYYLIPQEKSLSSPPQKGENFIAYLNLQELTKDYIELDVSKEVLEICAEKNPHSILIAREGFSFIILSLPDLKGLKIAGSSIGLYIDASKMLVISLDEEQISQGFFSQAMTSSSKIFTPGRFLFLFLREVLRDHYENYLDYERKIQNLEQLIWQTEDKSRKLEIGLSTFSRELLILQNFYGELSELLSWLEENEEDILREEDLPFFGTIHGRVDHYAGSVRFLRDYLGGVRSSYQAQLDLSMNKVMKIFTVISAVFLPLTLLVGWYGMNFHYMPELNWRYGYLTVAGLGFLFVALVLIYLKKKRIL